MTLLSGVNTRIDAILFEGYGTSSPVSQVAAIALPSGTFRPIKTGQLTDANVELNEVDRAVERFWSTIRTPNDNSLHSQSLRRLRLIVRNAVVFGSGAAAYIVTKDSETAATVAVHAAATTRVLEHAEDIAMALSHHAIHGNDTTPPIVSIVRDGDTTTSELAGNRIIATTTYIVTIVRSQAARYG